MKKLFGTDGVRGKANQEPITPETALKLGQAIAKHFQKSKKNSQIVIGKDTRVSSYMIELAIASGVCSMGSKAVLLGPISTPGVAFITKAMRADAGIMISASHNPFDDNGIKFFDHRGYKLSDEVESDIAAMVHNGFADDERPTGYYLGRATRVDDAIGRYVEFLKSTFPSQLTLDGLKIVVDCANGAAYKLAPMVFWELGADVVSIGVNPNGLNINKDCGALHPDRMVDLVRETKADIGIALDGDADRVILCDENGNIVDGDQVIALCARHLKETGKLNNDKIVGTIMSNMGVENHLKKQGISLMRTQVGDRYIIEAMMDQDLRLGGEPSGHIIFSDHATTGDGIIAALQVLAVQVESKRAFSDLFKDIPLYPQVSTKIEVKDKPPLSSLPEITTAIKELEQRLKGKGRTVVRYSGTEPVLRLMIEGEDKTVIQSELDKLAIVARQQLGA